MKRVYGSYTTPIQAASAVEELLKQGYSKSQIKVISNSSLGHEFRGVETIDMHKGGRDLDDDRSVWERIKDTFTFDEYNETYLDEDLDATEAQLVRDYKTNLDNGEIVVLVQGEAGGKGSFIGNRNIDETLLGMDRNVTRDRDTDIDRDLSDEDRVIKLKREELDIDKDTVEVGEVDIKKVVKQETKTIEVPIEKEEIIIERRPGTGTVTPGETIDDLGIFEKDNEIHIPIREERVEVSKKTVEGDEVVIKKEKHTEKKTIVENLKSEDIEVEGDGKVTRETTESERLRDKDKLDK